jgi:hypothetical protein
MLNVIWINLNSSISLLFTLNYKYMKKLSLSVLAIMIAASTIIAADKTPAKNAKAKTATAKTLKKDHCVKGSAECTKKGC